MAQTLPCLIDQRCHCFAGKITNEFPHLLQLIHCTSMEEVIVAAKLLNAEMETMDQSGSM